MPCVLVVEDNPVVRGLIDYYLGEAGYTVRAVADGPSALAAAQEETPDAVVLDLRMPGMEGREVFRRLKEHNPDLPVFVLSVFADFSSWRVDLEDAEGFFTKSADLTPLIQAIGQRIG